MEKYHSRYPGLREVEVVLPENWNEADFLAVLPLCDKLLMPETVLTELLQIFAARFWLSHLADPVIVRPWALPFCFLPMRVVEQTMELDLGACSICMMEDFLANQPGATGHSVWDFAWLLRLELKGSCSLHRFRKAIHDRFNELWINCEFTDTEMLKYFDGLILQDVRHQVHAQ